MAIIEWNSVRKGHALLAYFGGILVMLCSNALRISFLVIFRNQGLTSTNSRFHLEAGWLFFSAALLVCLSLTYRWMLVPTRSATA